MRSNVQTLYSLEHTAIILGVPYRSVARWRLHLPGNEPAPGGRGINLTATAVRALALWRCLRRAGLSNQRVYQLRDDVMRLAEDPPEVGFVAIPSSSRTTGRSRLRWCAEPCEALAAITRGEASTVFEWHDPLATAAA